MPRSHILTPLAMLLLASCDPGVENGGGVSGTPRQQQGKSGEQLPGNTASSEQIFAQDSLGRSPQPRNLIAGIKDTCPVHHQKMKAREIPIVFEDAAAGAGKSGSSPAAVPFPFGAERIVSAGTALLPGESLTARVYQCEACIVASRAAGEKSREAPAIR